MHDCSEWWMAIVSTVSGETPSSLVVIVVRLSALDCMLDKHLSRPRPRPRHRSPFDQYINSVAGNCTYGPAAATSSAGQHHNGYISVIEINGWFIVQISSRPLEIMHIGRPPPAVYQPVQYIQQQPNQPTTTNTVVIHDSRPSYGDAAVGLAAGAVMGAALSDLGI